MSKDKKNDLDERNSHDEVLYKMLIRDTADIIFMKYILSILKIKKKLTRKGRIKTKNRV